MTVVGSVLLDGCGDVLRLRFMSDGTEQQLWSTMSILAATGDE